MTIEINPLAPAMGAEIVGADVASGLSEAAQQEIRDVIARHQGQLLSMDNPTTTLEELFLTIVRDSEARPGRRSASLSDGRS